MQLIEKRFASRNLMQCRNCDRQCVSCTGCQVCFYPYLPTMVLILIAILMSSLLWWQSMARVHEDREDRFCLKCDNPKPEEVRPYTQPHAIHLGLDLDLDLA